MKYGLILSFALMVSIPLMAAERQRPSLTYQGRLKSLDGTSIALTQSVPILFALYTSETGGTPVWREMVTVTPGDQGNFAVTLFEGCGSKVDEASKTFAETLIEGRTQNQLWLGLTIGKESKAELRPRHAIGLVPKAHRARFAYQASGANFEVPENLTAEKAEVASVKTPVCILQSDGGQTMTGATVKTLQVTDAATVDAVMVDTTTEVLGTLRLETPPTASNDVVPIGAVILWYGAKDEIPDGWEIETALSGKFPRAMRDNYGVGYSSGSETAQLTIETMPSHSHGNITYNQPYGTGGYTHSDSDQSGGEKTWVSVSTTTITLAENSDTVGKAFNSMPPYKALYYIKRKK